MSAVLLGSGLGVGLWALTVWLQPPRPALGAVLQRVTATPPPTPILTGTPSNPLKLSAPWSRLDRPLIATLRSVGLPTPAMLGDLTVLEKPADSLLAENATWGLCGLFLPGGAVAALAALGGSFDFRVPIAVAVGCAVVGFVAPDVRVRRRAARRRADFRHALSAYLDLVVISLAGGAGVDSALHDSIAAGRGWAFHQLDRALTAARLTRATPWSTLQQLGRELDVTELTELAASVSLAGTEGARVRRSLTAKAASLRARELTDVETKASADTERMSLPIVTLLLGFLVFIAYPAVTQVLNGL